MKRVLCLPGGGAKGVLTATMLSNFEKHIGMTLQEYFNSVHGESVGSILGSLIAAGCPIEYIFEMLEKNTVHIFTPQNSWFTFWRKLTQPIYDRQRVVDAMEEALKSVGVETMGELKVKFVTGAVNAMTKESDYFKSDYSELKDTKITDIVKRSFGAPYYFSLVVDFVKKFVYADNGTGINNNPTLPAFFENIKEIMAGEEFEFYCFGTGYSDVTNTFETVSQWNNAKQVWDFYLSGGETLGRIQAQIQARTIMTWVAKNLPNVKFFYYDVLIPKAMDKIDGKEYLQQYIDFGNSVKF